MQVVARTPRINLHIEGEGINAFLDIVKKSIPNIQIIEDDEPDIMNIEDWDYFKELKSHLTPGKILKIRRENADLSQAALAEKCGIAASNIALMEVGKRSIGIRSAKKLAEALSCDAGDFVV